MAFKLVESAKFLLKADIGTANSKALTMNLDTYNKLPESVREIVHAVARDYRDYTAAQSMKNAAKAYEDFKKQGGSIIQMSQDARLHWAKSMPNIAKDWAAGLDKKGLPGTKILRSYMNKMRAANQPILRQWDKE